MPTSNTLAVVRAYHEAWTSRDLHQAIALLVPELVVEVPINDYPTKESFGEALSGFGKLVTSVDMLSEMDRDDEAMQLYDMRVEGLGQMRIVEHFTVSGGRIVRLRQIHDTAGLRGMTP